MPIHREALARRKARDGAIAAILGTPPSDEFGSLRLKWECTDYDQGTGNATRFESDPTEWCASGGGVSWYASLNGMYERGIGGRHRRFKSARAACKFIEDTKVPNQKSGR